MPQPTSSDVHVDALLTNVSVAYLQDQNRFVADKVFPLVSVQKRSDRYASYAKEYWFKTEARKRALSTESAGSGYEVDTTNTYFCDVEAVHKDIDDQVRANEDLPFNSNRTATEYVTRQLLLKRELNWMGRYFTTGVWTGSSTGGDITVGTLWDAASSTPIADIRKEITAILRNTGMMANTLTLSFEVWQALQDNADFIDRIKLSNDKIVTTDLLARVLGLARVLVAGAVYDDQPEKDATPNMDFAAGKHALLTYSAPRPSLMEPSAGYTFGWKGYVGASPQGTRISTFRMEHLKSDRVEGEMAQDQKLVAADCGAFFASVIS